MTFSKPAVLASTVAIAFGVGACGGTDEETTPAAESTPAGQQAEQQQAEPVAQIEQLGGETTTVDLDPAFLEALDSLGVTPAAVGDGEITSDGEAVFPITGGEVTYYEPGTVSPFVQGTIEHEGAGLSLEAGGTTVELRDFVIDPGESVLTGDVTANGEEVAQDAPLFFLDGSTLEPLRTRENGNAVLEGTTVKLKEEAARVLNDAFGITALEGGLEVGTARLVLSAE